jgi:tetratricopeptide (TPR) repeat protein
LLRQYAYGKLQEMGEPRPVHHLAAEYLNAKLTGQGGTPDEGLEMVDQWEQAEEWEQFARSASALVGSLDRMGYWGEIRERLERVRQAGRERLGALPAVAADLSSAMAIITAKSAGWDEAITLFEEAADLYRLAGNEKGLAGTYNNLGLVYADKGEWERAIEFYQNALQTMERLGDIHGMAGTFGNLGSVYADKGEWERAIEFYQKSLETKERVGDIYGMAQTYNNLGIVYLQKGEWERAIEFYQKSLETKERVGDIHGMAQTYNNLGLVYADKGEWERAIEFYQKSLETKERVGDIHGMAGTYGNLGNVYAGKGEWERAIEFYQKSLETKERLGDIHGMAATRANVGLLYMRTGRVEEAKPLLARAYLVLAELGSPDAQTAAGGLVRACGSVEAANAYLAQLAGGEAPSPAPPSEAEEGITLEQLLGYVARACRGDAALGEQSWPLVQQMAGDASQPPEVRALGRALTLVLAGERAPDLSALPPELAGAVRAMLDQIGG